MLHDRDFSFLDDLFLLSPKEKFQTQTVSNIEYNPTEETRRIMEFFGLTAPKTELPKIYLAARYARREEMEVVADKLSDAGFGITSHWVYGAEEGLTYEDIAVMDIDDVTSADVILSFTEPYGTPHVGGGRHVEFGYGLALGKEMAIVGYTENVFHYYPDVRRYDNLEDFIRFYVR